MADKDSESERRDNADVNLEACGGEDLVVNTKGTSGNAVVDMASTDVANNASTTVPGVAAQKVFDIPELLEQILLELDPLGLYGVQRVSTAFNDTIAGSQTIQQRMNPGLGVQGDSSSIIELLDNSKLAKVIYPFYAEDMSTDDIEGDAPVVLRLWVDRPWFDAQPRDRTTARWLPIESTICEEKVASWNGIKFTPKDVKFKIGLHCSWLIEYWDVDEPEPKLGDVLKTAWSQFSRMNHDGDVFRSPVDWFWDRPRCCVQGGA